VGLDWGKSRGESESLPEEQHGAIYVGAALARLGNGHEKVLVPGRLICMIWSLGVIICSSWLMGLGGWASMVVLWWRGP
jgi:hypothetical protein